METIARLPGGPVDVLVSPSYGKDQRARSIRFWFSLVCKVENGTEFMRGREGRLAVPRVWFVFLNKWCTREETTMRKRFPPPWCSATVKKYVRNDAFLKNESTVRGDLSKTLNKQVDNINSPPEASRWNENTAPFAVYTISGARHFNSCRASRGPQDYAILPRRVIKFSLEPCETSRLLVDQYRNLNEKYDGHTCPNSDHELCQPNEFVYIKRKTTYCKHVITHNWTRTCTDCINIIFFANESGELLHI